MAKTERGRPVRRPRSLTDMGAGVERAGDSCESRPEPKGSKMKPRHAAAVALGAEPLAAEAAFCLGGIIWIGLLFA